MLLKWLLLSGVIWVIYRFYLNLPSLTEGRKSKKPEEEPLSDQEGEFIDYEEVE